MQRTSSMGWRALAVVAALLVTTAMQCDPNGLDGTLTVQYARNGATGDLPGSHSVPLGETIIVEASHGLEREWFSFAGWNTESDGSGDAYQPGESLEVLENITLYAQWTIDSQSLAPDTVFSEMLFDNRDQEDTAGRYRTSLLLANDSFLWDSWYGVGADGDGESANYLYLVVLDETESEHIEPDTYSFEQSASDTLQAVSLVLGGTVTSAGLEAGPALFLDSRPPYVDGLPPGPTSDGVDRDGAIVAASLTVERNGDEYSLQLSFVLDSGESGEIAWTSAVAYTVTSDETEDETDAEADDDQGESVVMTTDASVEGALVLKNAIIVQDLPSGEPSGTPIVYDIFLYGGDIEGTPDNVFNGTGPLVWIDIDEWHEHDDQPRHSEYAFGGAAQVTENLGSIATLKAAVVTLQDASIGEEDAIDPFEDAELVAVFENEREEPDHENTIVQSSLTAGFAGGVGPNQDDTLEIGFEAVDGTEWTIVFVFASDPPNYVLLLDPDD